MRRTRVRLAALVTTAVACVLAAGCTAGGNAALGSRASAPTSPVSSVSSVPDSSAPATAPSMSSSPEVATTASAATPSPSTSASPAVGNWVAPDYGKAKDAVDTYLKVMAAYNAALATPDPNRVDLAVIDENTADQAHTLLSKSLNVDADTAYRGTPDRNRVEVRQAIKGALGYVLSDCPAISPSWKRYDVKTGLDVPTTARTPPPPYETTALVGMQVHTWRVLDLSVDFSKTCVR